jgi:spoIIIJ-associated protein
MIEEHTYPQMNEKELLNLVTGKLGNEPYRLVKTETGYLLQIANEDDPIDLYGEELDALTELLEGFLDAMDLEGELGYDILGQTIWVNIDGPDAGIFLRNHGELLNALQTILEYHLNRHFPDTMAYVKCDAMAKRRAQIDAFIAEAVAAAEAAVRTGQAQSLPGMNAYERRIIHLALQNHPEVVTRSQGQGPVKKIIVQQVVDSEPNHTPETES